MPRNKDWRPSAPVRNLRVRAELLSDIRAFFHKRDVLEVDTPLMCHTAATDPYLKPIGVRYTYPTAYPTTHANSGANILAANTPHESAFYLQTSPEFAMKRLLAAGSGSIYQISKAFRDDEVGRLHNPEFTILEWYRLGFDHHALMDEVEDLLRMALEMPTAERFTYGEIFWKMLTLNPHQTSREALKHRAISAGITLSHDVTEHSTADDWLDILMTHCIEPHLGFKRPAIIYDFPSSKAALAKIRAGDPSVAERFEVYVRGIELANGYHELIDPEAQRVRFQQDFECRKKLGYPEIPIDDYLLQALEFGMPASAGVALGIDRLLMLKVNSPHIQEVVAFTIDRA